MKKIKTFVLILICLFSGTFLFACDKTVHVETISLSETEVVLRPNESKDINISINPNNATNKDFRLILTDNSFVEVVVDPEIKTKAKIVAKDGLVGTFTTFLQAVSEDGEKRSEFCKIVVYTNKTALFAPQNLKYDSQSQLISWDNIASASGYKLRINIEGQDFQEEICATNSYKIDEYYNKKISVQVKSLGDDVVYTDSDYGDKTFTFLQLEEPKNLSNSGNFVKFNKVENASYYKIYVFENSLENSPSYIKTIEDENFDESVGVEIEALKNPGKNYLIKVQAFASAVQDLIVYESKCQNYIEISKIATPIVNNSDLKFTYNSNTISWTANPNASGYKLKRYKNGTLEKEYLFKDETLNVNHLVIDKNDDKLVAGKYNYTLTILGNGEQYLDSNESDGLEIEKLSAPTISVKNGEIVWNSVENIGGYKLVIENKLEENLSQSQTRFSLESSLNRSFNAGTYGFKIASVGNKTNTITSEFSDICYFDKLDIPEKPSLVENRYLKFRVADNVQKLKVLLTHYGKTGNADIFKEWDVTSFDNLTSQFDMLEEVYNDELYPSGKYKVYTKVYAENMLMSEPSEIFEFEKLENTQTIIIQNGKLSYTKPENVNKVEVYLNDVSVYSSNPEDFDINSIQGFVAGREYSIRLRFYPQSNTNVVISNKTEKVNFQKINASINELSVQNGEILMQSSITGKTVFEVKLNGTDEVKKYYNLSEIKFEENNIYKIKMYFEGDNYNLNSDYSNEIEVKLMKQLLDLEINDGVVTFTPNNAGSYDATIKSGSVNVVAENISDFSSFGETADGKYKFNLKDLLDCLEPSNYNLLGDNIEIYLTTHGCTNQTEVDRETYSSLSNKSNSVLLNYQLINEIVNLTLTDDTFSFETCDAENYYARLILSGEEQTVNLSTLSSFVITDNVEGKANFSVTEIIKKVYPDTYGKLDDIVELYVLCDGLKSPFKVNGDIIKFRTVNKSESFYLNILNNPVSLRASKLTDLMNESGSGMIDDYEMGINKLYFECSGDVEMFQLDYTNSASVTKTKILTLNDYLNKFSSSDGTITYQINTAFLSPDNYSFKLRSVCSVKGEMNSNSKYVYNFNSFEVCELNNITKLQPVSSIVCEDGKIIINDDASAPSGCANAYILTINDKLIYEDVLGEGKDLNSVIAMASSNPAQAISLINGFKTKERELPSSCCGTFDVSVIKVVIPSNLLISLMSGSGGEAIQADKPKSISVTRLETVKTSLKNGVIEWNSISEAESYSLYELKEEDGKKVINYEKLIVTKNAGEELKFDIYNHLSGQSGSYSYAMIANTSKDNYLSSLKSENIEFEILSTPEMYIEHGKLNWDAIANCAGYKLEVYKEGLLFDTFILNRAVLSYDAMYSSKNKLLDSANYEFRITALGEIELNSQGQIVDETSVIKSLTTNPNTLKAFKLQTPQVVRVEDGKIVLSEVNSNSGVECYNLLINNKETLVDKTKLKFELASSYNAGVYNLFYQAVGDDTCLSSNYSQEFTAEKLSATSKIYTNYGELAWNIVEANNYDNGSSSVKYYFSLNKEASVYSQQTTVTSFEISKNDSISFGLYTFEVKVLGDNSYYLNSNSKYLNNVVKLANVQDIRIENGILTWTNPNPTDIIGLPANTKASPNGYKLKVERGYDYKEFIIPDGVNQFVLDENFDYGNYAISIQNIGNTIQEDVYNFANSKIVSNNVYKLMALTDLNISDGINLKWKNPNVKLVWNFVINIKCAVGEETTNYKGVVYNITSNSIRFEDLCYYVNDENERIIVLATDSLISEDESGNLSYNGYEVKKFDGNGKIEIYVNAFGADEYITSEKSNTITITRPDEVANLKIEHGKISWTKSEDANGYILSLTRYTLNENQEKVYDEEFESNYSLVYVTKTYYNLFDVNYYYSVKVRAYSLITSENEQTMASKPVSVDDYLFNSFTSGSGTKQNPYLITDESTLGYIKYNNLAYYELANDITLTKNWTPLFTDTYPFAGNINGNGKSIKNLTIAGEYSYSGLLGYIGSDTLSDDRVVNGVRTQFISEENQHKVGRIENLDFNLARVTAGFNVAIICGVNEGEIYNINIRNSKVCSASQELVDSGASYRSIYSGLVTAINNGKIEKCSIQNENGSTRVEPSAKTSLYSGGICAINNGDIKYCYVNTIVYGTVAGGISAINNKNIDFCGVYGTVTCENYVSNKASLVARAGGICAYNSENARVSNVVVENELFGATDLVGISNISNINVSNEIIYVGGLIGENNGECFNSVVKIDIFNKSDKSIDCVLGYLFGYNKNNSVYNNKYILSSVTQAKQISGDNTSINSSNCEIENYSQSMIDEFNNYNTTQNISDYEWNFVTEYKFNDEIVMNINIGFIKV